MPTETITKAKSTKTCRECGSNLAGSATKCQNCNSTNLSKSIVIIRKSEATGEDALAPDPPEVSGNTDGESGDEEEEYEDLDESDFEAADDGDEDDDEDDDSDDEDEDDSEDEEAEEDDEEDEEDPKVSKKIVRRRRVAKSAPSMESVNLDILLAALTVADDISKAVEGGSFEGDDSDYERAMTAFNNICDAGVVSWGSGESISKEDDAAKLKRLKARVAEIRAKLKGAGVSDDEDDDVEKSEDIFKGLSPAAAAILREAQATLEEKKVTEFQEVAKSFGTLPTSHEELGAALRTVAETDKTAFDTITKALKAAAEAQQQSDIFKSFGTAQAGLAASGGTELDTIAKSIMGSNSSLTEEQAYAQALHQNPSLYDEYIAKAARR